MVEKHRTVLPPLLVFADDWGRHPSSCQHLMRQLLGRYEIHWINTIGMRPPRLDLATLRRGAEKLRQWGCAPPMSLPAHLQVHNPRMWPWFRSNFGRWLNRYLLGKQLTRLISTLPAPPIAVTTVPIVADLVGRLPTAGWVYYCVDDFGQWPGLDQKVLQHLDDELIRRADVLFAVSETLQERIRSRGRDATLLTHGVDIDHWMQPGEPCPPLLEGLERPWVVFWGVIDRRMDLRFLQAAAAKMTRGSILLIGPQQDPSPELRTIPRIHFSGPLPLDQLPAVAHKAAVLIMPYADLPVTQAMQPLKLKEYLATGRPVVVRDLPATRPWRDTLDLAANAEEFADLVARRLDGVLDDQQEAARKRLVNEGWQTKADLFERTMLTRLAPQRVEA